MTIALKSLFFSVDSSSKNARIVHTSVTTHTSTMVPSEVSPARNGWRRTFFRIKNRYFMPASSLEERPGSMAACALDQLALVEVQHAVGAAGGPRIVRDQQDRLAERPAKLRQQVEDFVGGMGVQVAGGLVGHDERGVGDDGPGDAHTLLLAAGELARAMIHAVGEADQFQGREHLAAPLGRRQRQQQQGQLDVFIGRQHGQQMVELEDEAEVPGAPAGQLRFRHGRDQVVAHPHLALRWADPARR